LVVVVVALARKRPALALGNVVGSAISNILGAFSLGLVFRKGSVDMYDRSSRIYTGALLLVTFAATVVLAFGQGYNRRAIGGIFVGLFGLYVASISFLIAKGFSTAPEDLSDSDSDSDASDDEFSNSSPTVRRSPAQLAHVRVQRTPSGLAQHHNPEQSHRQYVGNASENSPLLDGVNSADQRPISGSTLLGSDQSGLQNPDIPESERQFDTIARHHSLSTYSTLSSASSRLGSTRRRPRGLAHHVALLILGFIAILLSSYVLSTAAACLVDQLGVSDLVFGVVVLSIATTLPEKLIAIMSGYKGHMGIMVANTVGSNIFLLTLCLGIIWLNTDGDYNGQVLAPAEIAVMFGSTSVLAVSVLVGGRFSRAIGVAMFVGYVAFIVLEFTTIHHLDN